MKKDLIQQHTVYVWFPGGYTTEGRDFGSPKVGVSFMLGVRWFYDTSTDVYGFR